MARNPQFQKRWAYKVFTLYICHCDYRCSHLNRKIATCGSFCNLAGGIAYKLSVSFLHFFCYHFFNLLLLSFSIQVPATPRSFQRRLSRHSSHPLQQSWNSLQLFHHLIQPLQPPPPPSTLLHRQNGHTNLLRAPHLYNLPPRPVTSNAILHTPNLPNRFAHLPTPLYLHRPSGLPHSHPYHRLTRRILHTPLSTLLLGKSYQEFNDYGAD